MTLVHACHVFSEGFTCRLILPIYRQYSLGTPGKGLAIEIDGFVRHLNERLFAGSTRHFTPSAFIQNRKKINPEVFNHFSDVIVDNFYTAGNDSLADLNGFRVLAVDGSRITLPNTAELKKTLWAHSKPIQRIGHCTSQGIFCMMC